MAGFQSFIFGGDTPWSYEELQRQKAIADSLRQANMATPRNVGEGLAAVGRALGARRREKRAMTREEELKAELQAQIAAALGGGGYGGAMPGISTPGVSAKGLGADPNSPQGIADDAMAALGRPAVNDASMRIRAGLIERGLPEHVADAFVVNFQDESGLNAGINEAAPVVPGSRGGFGLAQWTGPRRVALERFAAQRGVPASDEGVQLDFLMQELQGPEAAAGSAIMAAPDRATAADAVLREFLRPAPENVARRSAQYTGGQPSGGRTSEIAALLANPMLPQDVRNLIMAQAAPQAPMSELDQLKLQRERFELEALQNPQVQVPQTLTERKALAAEAGLRPGTPEYTAYIATGNLTTPGGGAEFGLNPILGRDKDGNVVVMQLGKNGTAVVTDLPEGVTADMGLKAFETAQGAALGRGAGEATASAQVALPGATQISDEIEKQITALKNDPYLPQMLGPIDSRKPNVTEDAARVQGMIDQLKGGAFLQARQMLKGGGAITDFESTRAETAFIRANEAQSVEDFTAALDDFNYFVKQGVAKLAKQAGSGGAAVTAATISSMSRDDFNAWFADVDVMSLPSDVIAAAIARLQQ